MLTENGKNALPEPIVKRLDEINTLCLETMGKRIKEIGELSPSDAHKLARQLKLGADVRKIEHELSKATALSVADIEKIFEIVANDNVKTAKAMLEAGGTVIPYAENKELQRWVSALAKQTEQELINLAKTTAFMRYDEKGNKVLSSLSETYNTVIDKAVASASPGVVDYKTAMRKTLKELADSGLRTKYKKLEGSAGPTVDYATGYSRRLDTAVRQNILWGIKECNLGVQEQIGEEFGADGYEIDYHRNPRPSHAEMGGRQYVKGKARYIKGKYYESFEVKAEPLLAEYGCLHFKFPIICGISRPIYSDEELARLKAEDSKTFEYEGKTYTGYEAKQMQRKLETAIRHAKDRQKIAKAAGDDTLRRQEQKKLNDLTRKYKDFSEKAGLSVKKNRMSVSGYHRVKPLDNGGGSGIIGVGSENVALEYQRYGRNKNTLVNKTYIDGGEYRRKFDNLTDNPTVNKAIYDKAKEALKHRSGTEFEDMYWFDSNTGAIIAQEINSTDKRAIVYSDKTRYAVEKCSDLIALHTHPSSMPPSVADFNSCFRNKYKIGYVACHNGKIFAYTSNQEISESLFELYISEYYSEGLSEYDAQLKALNKIKENHAIDFWEVL